MQSLRDHCLHAIAICNLQIAPVIGTILELDIRMKECNLLCGETVGKSVLFTECAEYCIYVGWMSGLNYINQNKHFYESNYSVWIENCKTGSYNVGHVPCNYVLYYIKQDLDCERWLAQSSKYGLPGTSVWSQAISQGKRLIV
jgi:hypothetical protein